MIGAALPLAATESDILSHLPAHLSSDHIVQYRYDGAGRLHFTVDGTGGVTEFRYDAGGNVIDRIAYANAGSIAAGSRPRFHGRYRA